METLGCPISRVFCEKWGFTFEAAPISSNGANLHLQHGPVVHPDGSGLIVSIVTKAAPPPLLGLLHQTAPDRIPMNVPQLLNPFMAGRPTSNHESLKDRSFSILGCPTSRRCCEMWDLA